MLKANLSYTVRSFRKTPGLTAIAILSLALGMGANTAVFSLLDQLLLRSLPVRAPQQLVLFTANGPRQGMVNTNYDDRFTFSYPMYFDFRDRAPNFDGVLAWSPFSATLSTGGQTELVGATVVSGNYFQVLGVATAIGRPIVPDDARTLGSNAVAVLSYGFWQVRFGGDAGILGRKISINGQPFTVIGVAGRGFGGLAMGEAPAVYIPVTMQPQLAAAAGNIASRRNMWLNVMGRMKPGVSLKNAEAGLNAFWKPILADESSQMLAASARSRAQFVNRHITLQDASNGISLLRMVFGKPLALLMGLVGLVLLVACVNVANLMLARTAGRQREIATRIALGATLGDIIRQTLCEGLVLACGGGALAVLLAIWGGRILIAFLPFADYTASISPDPDWRTLAFTAAVSLVCGLTFGLAPALQTRRTDLAFAIKAQASAVTAAGSHVLIRRTLVVAQMALSFVLLTGAGLFLRSLGNLEHVDLGFRTDHLMSISIQPSPKSYTKERLVSLFETLRQRMASLPGVRAAAATQTPLLANMNWDAGVTVPGYQRKEGEDAPNLTRVSPGYFTALGIPIAAGRDLLASDDSQSPLVAVVNQTFAQYYFGGGNPIGKQFYFSSDAARTPVEIVGLVKDSKYANVREEKQRFVFCPYTQRYDPAIGAGLTYYVRTEQDPESIASALRHVVRESGTDIPVYDVKTMTRQIDEAIFADRMVSMLSAFFGVLATILAAIGLYGVVSYMVTRRTREIGIRMALGAGKGDVVALILREVAILAALGMAIAAAMCFPLTELARSMLFGVAPHNGLALAGAAVLLTVTSAAAGYLPALRASRVDPLVALRND
jgi:predicted permease